MAGHDCATRPWRPRSEARTLRHWPPSALQAMHQRVRAAVAAWCRDWGLAVGEDLPDGLLAAPLQGGSRMALHSLEGATVAWLAWSASSLDDLAQRLFGAASADATVTRQVCTDCQASLAQHLGAAFGLGPRGPHGDAMPDAAALTRPWSGIACVALPAGACLVADAGLQRMLPLPPPGPLAPRPPVTRVHEAAAHLPVRLRALLADCRLDAGTLDGLVPGDVLPLRHPLDAGVRLAGPDGEPVLQGWLGRRGPWLALELAGGRA